MPRPPQHTSSAPSAQASARHLELWATEVVPHLPPDLEEQARIRGAFQRRRARACASDRLRALRAAVLVATSRQQLGCGAVAAAVADSAASAWQKRLVRSRAWLVGRLGELLVTQPTPAQVRLFPQAHGHVLLVDATYLGPPGGTGDDGRLPTADTFTIGRLVQGTVTDQTGGEHRGYSRIQPADIVVADNGYG